MQFYSGLKNHIYRNVPWISFIHTAIGHNNDIIHAICIKFRTLTLRKEIACYLCWPCNSFCLPLLPCTGSPVFYISCSTLFFHNGFLHIWENKGFYLNIASQLLYSQLVSRNCYLFWHSFKRFVVCLNAIVFTNCYYTLQHILNSTNYFSPWFWSRYWTDSNITHQSTGGRSECCYTKCCRVSRRSTEMTKTTCSDRYAMIRHITVALERMRHTVSMLYVYIHTTACAHSCIHHNNNAYFKSVAQKIFQRYLKEEKTCQHRITS